MTIPILEGRVWHVREGDHYIFHLEPLLDEDAELAACLIEADERHPRLRQLLGQVGDSSEKSERFVKVNYWLFVEPWLPPEELRRVPEASSSGEAPARAIPWAKGEVTQAGIAFGQRGFRWADLTDTLAHEEAHLAWIAELGYAPYLLNEGVATWFELCLSRRDRLGELLDAWPVVIDAGGWRLRELARGDGFAEAYRQGLPVYQVGAALTGYLIEVHGLSTLKDIFRATFDEDDELAAVIERQTGDTIETIEARVAEWLPRAVRNL